MTDFVDLVGLTNDPLQLEPVVERALRALEGGAGAVVPFVGVVRNNALGHRIARLEYHAYPPMALAEMRKIADEVRAHWDLPCAIWHRVGTLAVGDISVVVAVASPHRNVAFDACRYAIDTVKLTVPIWKKEFAEDGHWWVEDPVAATA